MPAGDDRAHGLGARVDDCRSRAAGCARPAGSASAERRSWSRRRACPRRRRTRHAGRSPAGSGSRPPSIVTCAVGQHDLDRQHVGARHAVGEAMRSARVRGDVAADRARLLARRIRREVQPEMGDGSAQVEVQHARLDPRDAGVGIDREHAVHLRRDDHDRVVERHRSARQTRAGATGDEGAAVRDGGCARTPAPLRSSRGSRPRRHDPRGPKRRARTARARSVRP